MSEGITTVPNWRRHEIFLKRISYTVKSSLHVLSDDHGKRSVASNTELTRSVLGKYHYV